MDPHDVDDQEQNADCLSCIGALIARWGRWMRVVYDPAFDHLVWGERPPFAYHDMRTLMVRSNSVIPVMSAA
jgi:hypothetical protein